MGCISDRHMKSGGSIGGRKGKHKGPLRKVVSRTYYAQSMFDTDHGILECGHTSATITSGALKARCKECGKDDPKYNQERYQAK
jgi:hypothetical protein